MTDTDRDHLIELHLKMLTMLGWAPPGDALDQIVAGGILVTTQAMDACEVSKTTIHRWLADAEAKGRPLGVLTPAGYLIGLARLLDYVQAEQGLPARVKAATRAKKYAAVWSQPQLSLKMTGT